MLQTKAADSTFEQPASGFLRSDSESIFFYIDILKRQFPVVIGVLLVCLVLGLMYLFSATPMFTSTAILVIDTRKMQLFQQQFKQQPIRGDIAVDAGTVTTQVEILKSEKVSLSVIKDLGLANDPEFTGFGAGVVGAGVEFVWKILDGTLKSEVELTRTALRQFQKQFSINRVGLTYVMEINFTSADPEKAARISAPLLAGAYPELNHFSLTHLFI